MNELQMMGVQEMNVQEMKNENGGIAPLIIAAVIVVGFVGGFLFGKELKDRGVEL